LHNTTEQFVINISAPKCKVMAFQGQVPIGSQTATDYTTLGQVTTDTYWEMEFNKKRKTIQLQK
jgi:hypothetical protein